MPNVYIREKDNTNVAASLKNKYTVLIAGGVSANDTVEFKEELFTNLSEFKTKIASAPSSFNDKYQVMAYECLNSGLQVYYVNNTVTSGTFVYDDKYMSRMSYDFDFIVPSDETADAQRKAIDIAATRGDCIALVDIPVDNSTTTPTEKSVAGIQSYISETFNPSSTTWDNMITRECIEQWTSADGKEQKLNYVKFFAPHMTVDYGLTYETGDYQPKDIPASLGVLTAFGKSVVQKGNKAWFSIAGDERGLISLSSDKVTLNKIFTEAEINNLQKRDTRFATTTETTLTGPAVNVIIDSISAGIEVYGDRTGCANDGLIASSFGNIRMLSNILKKRMYLAGNKYRWEPNSDLMWTNFTDFVNVTVNEMQENQGIRGYKWTKYINQSKALLSCKLTIIPIEPVEDFDITLELSNEL